VYYQAASLLAVVEVKRMRNRTKA